MYTSEGISTDSTESEFNEEITALSDENNDTNYTAAVILANNSSDNFCNLIEDRKKIELCSSIILNTIDAPLFGLCGVINTIVPTVKDHTPDQCTDYNLNPPRQGDISSKINAISSTNDARFLRAVLLSID